MSDINHVNHITQTHDDNQAIVAIQSLRIDTPVASSRLQVMGYFFILLLLFLLASLAHLLWWQWLIFLLVSGVVLLFIYWQRLVVLHLIQPPLTSPIYQGWQLFIKTAMGEKLWQADLCHIKSHGVVVELSFEVFEPLPKTLNMVLYKDQVPKKAWRQLQVLAHCQ